MKVALLLACSLLLQGDTEPSVAVPRHSLVVQPIVVRGDAGEDPAAMRFLDQAVTRSYTRAETRCHFLEAIYFDDTEARDGEVNLDTIVRRAEEAQLLRGGGRVVNMFFVDAVDGRVGPLGRGQQNGSIAFIALGDEPAPDMEAFVVAHETGHCLGLLHSVDDPAVPNELVNLMGDGPFAERTAPEGLHPSQVRTIQSSPLVMPHVRALGLEEARLAIVDESSEPFFANLEAREIAAFTGSAVEATDPAARRDAARAAFADAALACTPEEEAALVWLTGAVLERVGGDLPLLAQQPWWFIKAKDELCGGFSRTRGLAIVFAERTVARVLAAHRLGDVDTALRDLGPLFAHEQLHVIERCYPERFAQLFTEVFGFRRGRVAQVAWLTERQVTNPDGVRAEWLMPVATGTGERLFQLRTVLRDGPSVPRMGYDFLEVLVEVMPGTEPGSFEVICDESGVPVPCDRELIAPFLASFGIEQGLDHPNEIASYLLGAELTRRFAADPESAEARDPMATAFLDWCLANLR